MEVNRFSDFSSFSTYMFAKVSVSLDDSDSMEEDYIEDKYYWIYDHLINKNVKLRDVLGIQFYNSPSVTKEKDTHPLREIWPNILAKVHFFNLLDEWLNGRIQIFRATYLTYVNETTSIGRVNVILRFNYAKTSSSKRMFNTWWQFIEEVQKLEMGTTCKLTCTYFNVLTQRPQRWYHYVFS